MEKNDILLGTGGGTTAKVIGMVLSLWVGRNEKSPWGKSCEVLSEIHASNVYESCIC